MATRIPLKPTSTLENVGHVAFILCGLILTLMYGPAVLAHPFVKDMGNTTVGIASAFTVEPAGISVEERYEQPDALDQSAANVGKIAPKNLPATKKYYVSKP